MKKENQHYFQEQNSWFDCIGDIQQNIKQKKQKQNVRFETEIFQFQKEMKVIFSQGTQDKTLSQELFNQKNRKNLKRIRNDASNEDQWLTENSSSNEVTSKTSDGKIYNDRDGKSHKQEKQHIYSKNYRARKKEHIKLLEEQNSFLKKKINQLEFRLRQMELEMNRMKFMPQEKQFTIEQLNEQFMQKVTVMMQKNKDNPAEYKSKYDPSEKFYEQFMQTYSKHGFGGSKKIDIMNYYFNQILQATLRDSQKYFSIICYNAKDGDSISGMPDYQTINLAFMNILKPDQDKLKRLRYFQINLHPMVKDFVQAIKQFYFKFNKILVTMNKIHVFMKSNYPSNFDFARLRIIELESWFQQHKYSKMMRNLRQLWIQTIKDENQEEERKNSSGTKKKKLNHKQS